MTLSDASDAIRELEARVLVLEAELKDKDERLKKAKKIAAEIDKTAKKIKKEAEKGVSK